VFGLLIGLEKRSNGIIPNLSEKCNPIFINDFERSVQDILLLVEHRINITFNGALQFGIWVKTKNK
jgi:hypothetical protein